MTDYRTKLQRLAAQPRWKRILFTLSVNGLLLAKHLRDFHLYLNYHFPRRRFVLRTAPRAHYIGYPAPKPHRFDFFLLAVVLASGIGIAGDTLAVVHWSLAWGVVFSLWVLAQSCRRVLKWIRE